MSKGRIAIIAALAILAAFLVIGIAASGGGEEKENGTPEIPETPDEPKEDATSISLDRYKAYPEATDVIALTATAVSDGPVGVVWTSSDESIATVDNGKVQFKKWGPVVIAAEAGGCRAECLMVVDSQAHASALSPTDRSAAVVEGKRVLRAYAMCEAEIVEALASYGYSEATAKSAAADCTGEWQFYADKAAQRIYARGGCDKDAVADEMLNDGWAEAYVREALDMIGR